MRRTSSRIFTALAILCCACGRPLPQQPSAGLPGGPDVKTIASFETANPFVGNGTVVAVPALGGRKALRIDREYARMDAVQNWEGYDYLKADTYIEGPQPLPVTIEIHDTQTTGYWTRVNYNTVVTPGAGTLIVPLHQLYVGEKSRPGHPLILGGITMLAFLVGDAPPQPLFLDRVRLERDTTARNVFFPGLHAFDFGPASGPVMDGFTPITPATVYSRDRGYGLKNARIWRAFDVLQPDPLYQDFLCIESGGLAIDVPNGRYRVFVNLDSPSGYWGEYQAYAERSILAQGKTVVAERMDFNAFRRKYFRFWDTEDLPADNTFDKYQRPYFSEKIFDAEVSNGQLYIEFHGENWANSVSAVIVFPVEKAAEGQRFLDYVREKRRFYFDNAFKRVLHVPTGDPVQATALDLDRGYILFHRDFMSDVYYNDTPAHGETAGSLRAEGFPGELVPVTLSVLPLKDLGEGSVTIGALRGPAAAIPGSDIDVGYVSYRLTRVAVDGSIYTITPRLIIPRRSVALPRAVARRFWFTLHVPPGIPAGAYTGQLTFTPRQGKASVIPLTLTVRRGSLDPVNIPAGPFGGSIGIPWLAGDPSTAAFAAEMTDKSLRMLRAHGFTLFTGVPQVAYKGFQNGNPVLDFSAADRQMADARRYGFLAVDSYGGGLTGLDAYNRDLAAMQQAGFTDYSAFIKAIYSAIQQHARQNNWLPVYWNLGDEPLGPALQGSIENAAAYRRAFPQGPPFFTAATSLFNDNSSDPNFELAKTLHVPSLNLHDESNIGKLTAAGNDWGYYNAASRWSFGVYLFKIVTGFHARFRVAWHWNIVAGDPYYPLDCREDDYAWANSNPEGELIPSVEFMRIAAGLTDYRYLLTLARLATQKPDASAAHAAEALIDNRMAAFHLGQLDHDKLFGAEDWAVYRRRLGDAIEALQ